MKLALPPLAFTAEADPIEAAVGFVVSQLEGRFGEVTDTTVHSGTRAHRLLKLGSDVAENFRLVNVYEASRKDLRGPMGEIIAAANAKPDSSFKLRLAPSGYTLNGVDLGSIAYMIACLVYDAGNLEQPIGAIFVQAYSVDRENAPSLKNNGSGNSGEIEYEGAS